MKIDDVFKLLEAGFSHDEIVAMTAQEEEPASDPQPEAPEEEPAQQEESPAEAPAHQEKAPAEDPAGSALDYIETLRTEISDLRKLIQKNNVMTAEQSSNRQTQKSDEDIIASIIKGG